MILATASYDHSIRFWEAKSGRCYRTINYQDSVCSFFFFFFFLIEPILILVKFVSHTTELRNREKPTFIFIH